MILRRPGVRTALYSLAAIALAVGAVVLWQWRKVAAIAENAGILSEGSEWASQLGTPEDLTRFIAAHREGVSIAAYEIGHADEGLFWEADRPRGIASAMKILVLSAYARAVASGEVDPDEPFALGDWETFYLPGTDGGAHPAALAELEAKETIHQGTVPLREVVRAMILHSDNAATDAVLFRLGQSRIDAEPAALGLDEEAPFPISGALLLAREPPEGMLPRQWIATCAQKGRAFIRAEAWRRAAALRDDTGRREHVVASLAKEGIGLNLREQHELAKALCVQGTARGYAQLMERVVTAPSSSKWALLMAEQLEWPMRPGGFIAQHYDRFGTKGGSMPGVITEATFATPKEGHPHVVAVFFEDLPMAVFLRMQQTFVHQEFERRLIGDEAFVRKVRDALFGTPGGQEEARDEVR